MSGGRTTSLKCVQKTASLISIVWGVATSVMVTTWKLWEGDPE